MSKKSKQPVYDLSEDNYDDGTIDETRGQFMTAIIHRVKVNTIYEAEKPDELIAGSDINAPTYEIVLRTPGEYKRGELVMMSGDQFVHATAEGIASAEKLAVLADDWTVGEEEYAEVVAYMAGRFFGSRIVLNYETESDSHEALLSAIKDKLMTQSIYLS